MEPRAEALRLLTRQPQLEEAMRRTEWLRVDEQPEVPAAVAASTANHVRPTQLPPLPSPPE
jgi:hypothetical protein